MTKAPATPNNRRVLLIGWDAADWQVINPLMDAGKMPHLEKLVNGGVIGNLATLNPPLSPMMWTSIATGKRPYKHGIHGFSEPDPHSGYVRPVTNLARKTKTLWNIFNQLGKRSNVVGWWPSHPAEPINGVMVSNHFQQAAGTLDQPWPMRPGTVHPERLIEPLSKLRVHPSELEADAILSFVPKAAEVDQDQDKRLESVAKIIAENASVHAAATAIMQLEPWDFMAVYYDGIDHFGHGFMKYHPPRLPWISEQDFELYKDVIESGYRLHDLFLGAMLQLAGDDTTIVLVSDHGFKSDHLRPRNLPNEPAGPAEEHRHYGMFLMHGPGIRQDERVYGATLLDVAPTILAACGLPVGADMDGKALVNVFEDPEPVQTIPSWDAVPGNDGSHPKDRKIDPVEAREALNQLVALGYIDEPAADQDKAVAETVRELHFNVARSYLDAGEMREAARRFASLWEQFPEEHRFGIHLFKCERALRRTAEARATFDKLIARKQKYALAAREELQRLSEELKDKPAEDISRAEQTRIRKLKTSAGTNQATLAFMEASLLHDEGRHAEALSQLAIAEQGEVFKPALYNQIGDAYRRLKQFELAEQNYRKALSLDPEDAAAILGLARTFLARGEYQQAAQAALDAVGLIYFNPPAHMLLGVALLRMDRLVDAVSALQVAVSQNPNFAAAHRLLAHIYGFRLAKPKSAQAHRELARSAFRQTQALRDDTAADAAPDADAQAADLPLAGGPISTRNTGHVPASQRVTIVSGLPRSGTSMMMQMLAAGGLAPLTDEARAADRGNPHGYLELEKVKKLPVDKSWLDEAQGRSLKVVMPLVNQLPGNQHYRIIVMLRRLADVVRSQSSELRRLQRDGAKLEDQQLAASFGQQLKSSILHLRRQPNIDLLLVDYDATIADPQAAAGQLAEFLDAQLDPRAMAAAVNPQLHRFQATAPIAAGTA